MALPLVDFVLVDVIEDLLHDAPPVSFYLLASSTIVRIAYIVYTVGD
jgi:hypothetical protein